MSEGEEGAAGDAFQWRGRPTVRLIGRIVALLAAILALLVWSPLRGQPPRGSRQAVPCPLFPVPCS